MVKVSFQFDSTDSLSSAFFNWLSSFPFEKSGLRFETAIDYTDPKSENESDATHRIGNIIVDLTSDHLAQTDRSDDEIEDHHRVAMPKPPDNVYLDASEAPAQESYSSDVLGNQPSSRTNDGFSLKDFAFSDHSHQKTEVANFDLDLSPSRFGQESSTSTLKTDSIFVDSNGAAFDSDLDDDMMADVLFASNDDLDSQETHSEKQLEKEEVLNEMNSDNDEADIEQNSDSLDYLVDSLDAFNM